jgi:hypothetical protein
MKDTVSFFYKNIEFIVPLDIADGVHEGLCLMADVEESHNVN